MHIKLKVNIRFFRTSRVCPAFSIMKLIRSGTCKYDTHFLSFPHAHTHTHTNRKPLQTYKCLSLSIKTHRGLWDGQGARPAHRRLRSTATQGPNISNAARQNFSCRQMSITTITNTRSTTPAHQQLYFQHSTLPHTKLTFKSGSHLHDRASKRVGRVKITSFVSALCWRDRRSRKVPLLRMILHSPILHVMCTQLVFRCTDFERDWTPQAGTISLHVQHF